MKNNSNNTDRPSYAREELQALSIRELKSLLPLNDKYHATDRSDLIDHLISTGAVEVVGRPPVEYRLSQLHRMSISQLKQTMNEQAGVFFHNKSDVVEKQDMIDLFVDSGRLLLLSSDEEGGFSSDDDDKTWMLPNHNDPAMVMDDGIRIRSEHDNMSTMSMPPSNSAYRSHRRKDKAVKATARTRSTNGRQVKRRDQVRREHVQQQQQRDARKKSMDPDGAIMEEEYYEEVIVEESESESETESSEDEPIRAERFESAPPAPKSSPISILKKPTTVANQRPQQQPVVSPASPEKEEVYRSFAHDADSDSDDDDVEEVYPEPKPSSKGDDYHYHDDDDYDAEEEEKDEIPRNSQRRMPKSSLHSHGSGGSRRHRDGDNQSVGGLSSRSNKSSSHSRKKSSSSSSKASSKKQQQDSSEHSSPQRAQRKKIAPSPPSSSSSPHSSSPKKSPTSPKKSPTSPSKKKSEQQKDKTFYLPPKPTLHAPIFSVLPDSKPNATSLPDYCSDDDDNRKGAHVYEDVDSVDHSSNSGKDRAYQQQQQRRRASHGGLMTGPVETHVYHEKDKKKDNNNKKTAREQQEQKDHDDEHDPDFDRTRVLILISTASAMGRSTVAHQHRAMKILQHRQISYRVYDAAHPDNEDRRMTLLQQAREMAGHVSEKYPLFFLLTGTDTPDEEVTFKGNYEWFETVHEANLMDSMLLTNDNNDNKNKDDDGNGKSHKKNKKGGVRAQ